MAKARRGGEGGGRGGKGGGRINATNERSLISQRERQREEVDGVLRALKYGNDRYQTDVNDVAVAKIKGAGRDSIIAWYDGTESITFNEKFFDGPKLDQTYDDCVKSGFHPKRGKKTGIEAVAAHEYGHRLTARLAEKMGLAQEGMGAFYLRDAADRIVKDAMKGSRYKKLGDFRRSISGYADDNNAEAIAEAYADVWCNGRKAKAASKRIMKEVDAYF